MAVLVTVQGHIEEKYEDGAEVEHGYRVGAAGELVLGHRPGPRTPWAVLKVYGPHYWFLVEGNQVPGLGLQY